MMPGVDIGRMLTVRQVAAALGCGKSTVWEWVKTVPGFPRPYKLGYRITRWKVSEVEAYRDGALRESRGRFGRG